MPDIEDPDCKDFVQNMDYWRMKVNSRFFDIEEAHFKPIWVDENKRRAKQIQLKEIDFLSQNYDTGDISLRIFVAFGSGNISVNNRLGCYYTITIEDAQYCDPPFIANVIWSVVLPEYEAVYRQRLADLGW